MKDKELRKLIGSRAKQRRLELGVNQPYIAEKMGVTASTIQRYEAGTIDNTMKPSPSATRSAVNRTTTSSSSPQTTPRYSQSPVALHGRNTPTPQPPPAPTTLSGNTPRTAASTATMTVHILTMLNIIPMRSPAIPTATAPLP